MTNKINNNKILPQPLSILKDKKPSKSQGEIKCPINSNLENNKSHLLINIFKDV